VHAAAESLASSNLTVLNGAEGLNQMLGGLLTAGMSMLNRVQSGLPAGNGPVPAPAEVAAAPAETGGDAPGATPGSGPRRSTRQNRG
jgi:hypothetical protein